MTSISKHQDKNQGEGNKEADRRYREQTESFVNSERGKEKIRKAGQLSPQEERDIRDAEEQAKGHAKEHDPEETVDFKHKS
jgi:hypothetical protein